jgi:hypothetical protein
MKTSNKLSVLLAIAATAAMAKSAHGQAFNANDILVSASTYQGSASTIETGTTLLTGASPTGTLAVANGSYPNLTNNDSVDGNFGITSPLSLLEINPTTDALDNTINVTALTGVVTSFTSKSEGSLNLSTNGTAVTIMGYDSGVNQIDISNSNTPGDPNGTTSTLTPATYRAIAQINADGSASETNTNLYSGDNPRGAILTSNGYYTVGNTGDKSSTGAGDTGAQLVTPGGTPGSNAVSLGSYNITQNGDAADKLAKDNNFRGETVFNNTLYVAKGSGSNGIDTVYQVGTTGSLPTGSVTLSILPGFNTMLATNDGAKNASSNFGHPFGLFFANASTLYVGDEGAPIANVASDIATLNGNPNSTSVDGQQFAGLDKYSLVSGVWKLDYVLNTGLNIGQNYNVTGTTPGGDTGTFTAATAGLRDITGKVNADGTVTIYGITSTFDSNGTNSMDPGEDPNKVVVINDLLSDTSTITPAESFTTIDTANYGQVLRGVSLTPEAVPEPSSWALALGACGLLVALRRYRRQA